MTKINKVQARQVFDSRGDPTIESEVCLDDGNKASAIVPSGISKGTHEAFELRDSEDKKYLGKSVFKAIEKVNGEIAKSLNGLNPEDQKNIDQTLIDLDGTDQKKRLGANFDLYNSEGVYFDKQQIVLEKLFSISLGDRQETSISVNGNFVVLNDTEIKIPSH